jgi:quaternary ammonium compound-resistance protein SugE
MMKQYAWVILVVAGVFETGWAVGLKYSQGFTRLWWSVATAAMIAISMGLLGVAARYLPLGTAYAVWTGIGAVGTVALGIMLFGESAAVSRMACLGLIVAGILGLKFLGE